MSGGPSPLPTTGRPRISVNCAVSLDGRLAYAHGRRARLSGPEDLRRVQDLRARTDAILVGVGTVVLDDPSLRVHWELIGAPRAHAPLRVVVDGSGRTPPHARVLDGTLPTLVATTEDAERAYPAHVARWTGGRGRVDLVRLFGALYDRGVRSVLVEGGSAILASVVGQGLFDELSVYYAPLVIGGRTAPPFLGGEDRARDDPARWLRLESVERLGAGFLARFRAGQDYPPGGIPGDRTAAP